MRFRWLILAVVLFGAIAVSLLWKREIEQPSRSLPRRELDLRDGVLYARGESQPFQGELVEHYSADARKLSIEIKDGRLHGRSVGWYPSGQKEVEEHFVKGVSHGTRTRWHLNGNRKSLAQIDQGKVTGTFIEWHVNGQKAAEMMMHEGKPDGVVQAWHPSGHPKSRSEFRGGDMVNREFFSDPQAVSNPTAAKRDK